MFVFPSTGTDVSACTRPRREPSPMLVVLPALAAGITSLLLLGSAADYALADWIYAAQGHSWRLADTTWLEVVAHQWGRRLSVAAWLVTVALLVRSLLLPGRWGHLLGPLAYLASAVLLATTAVSVMKASTGFDCPWDLARYGGDRVAHALFQAVPASQASGRCYPSGHASAGYAWFAAYFFFAAVKPALRIPALATAIGLGAAFGVAQQLRGAHFLSHDLMTVSVCWLVSAVTARMWGMRPPALCRGQARP